MHGHEPAAAPERENVAAMARRARAGRWLFALYLLLYGGFVGLNAFGPGLMSRTPWRGVNLAVLYGLGLIVAALVLAVVYDAICRRIDDRAAREERR